MKLQTMCMECMKELGHPSFEPIIADYFDQAISYITCGRGHRSAILIQSFKFEILLESAVEALIHGYTLEAASSLSAAYERTFEFAISVFAQKYSIEQQVFDLTFKQMLKQSERQIGAFLFLYAAAFGSAYKLSDEIPRLRNKVIHQGYIPPPDEVLKFGNKIYKEIGDITTRLREAFPKEISDAQFAIMAERMRSIPDGVPHATTTTNLTFCLSGKSPEPSFEQAISAYTIGKEILSSAAVPMQALFEEVQKFSPMQK